MTISEPANDPIAEFDSLTSELANLQKQFQAEKMKKEEFETQSKKLMDRIARAETMAYALARKNESTANRLRMRSYNDPTIQQVLNYFLGGSVQALEPEFGADHVPKYTLRSESGESRVVDRRVLQRMADIRLVTEALFEKMVFCPTCASPSKVYARFKCTHCGSIDVAMSRMIEHLNCGTIHQEEAFRVGGSMMCPTCKKPMQRNEEYRLIGLVCACKACGAHFEDPAHGYFCRNCKSDFTLPTAMIVDIFTYTLDKNVLAEARSHIGVDALAHLLTAEGFQVKSPGTVAGTGKEVEFSLTITKDSKVLAIDISQSDNEVDAQPLLQLYLKSLDTRITKAVLGVVPRLSDRAREIAPQHNITVAEGATISEVARKIIDIMKSV